MPNRVIAVRHHARGVTPCAWWRLNGFGEELLEGGQLREQPRQLPMPAPDGHGARLRPADQDVEIAASLPDELLGAERSHRLRAPQHPKAHGWFLPAGKVNHFLALGSVISRPPCPERRPRTTAGTS